MIGKSGNREAGFARAKPEEADYSLRVGSSAPSVRVRVAQEIAGEVNDLGGAARSDIQHQLGQAFLEDLSGRSAVGWYPLARHARIVRAIDTTLDRDALPLWERTSLRSLRSPLLQSTVKTATNLFGMNPGTFVRWLPKAWPIVTRDVLDFEVDIHATRATAVASHLAPDVRDTPGYDLCIGGILKSFLTFSRHTGELSIEPAADRIRFELRWKG